MKRIKLLISVLLVVGFMSCQPASQQTQAIPVPETAPTPQQKPPSPAPKLQGEVSKPEELVVFVAAASEAIRSAIQPWVRKQLAKEIDLQVFFPEITDKAGWKSSAQGFDTYVRPIAGAREFAKDQLSTVLKEFLAKNRDYKRVLIIIFSHGAENGDICPDGHGCDFNAQHMKEVIDEFKNDQEKHLKQLLVLPTSCYNHAFVTQLDKLLKQTHYDFEIGLLRQKNNESQNGLCVGIGLVENTLLNKKQYFAECGTAFKTWQSKLKPIRTLDEWLLQANAMGGRGADDNSAYDIDYINAAPPFLVRDFHFDNEVVFGFVKQQFVNLKHHFEEDPACANLLSKVSHVELEYRSPETETRQGKGMNVVIHAPTQRLEIKFENSLLDKDWAYFEQEIRKRGNYLLDIIKVYVKLDIGGGK